MLITDVLNNSELCNLYTEEYPHIIPNTIDIRLIHAKEKITVGCEVIKSRNPKNWTYVVWPYTSTTTRTVISWFYNDLVR